MSPETIQFLKDSNKSMIEFGKEAEKASQKLAETISKQSPLGLSFNQFAKDLPPTKSKTFKDKVKSFFSKILGK